LKLSGVGPSRNPYEQVKQRISRSYFGEAHFRHPE